MQTLKKRFPLFHQGPLKGHLLMETKCVELNVLAPMGPDLVHEFNEFFSWCEQHVEVNALYIKGLQGVDLEWMKEISQAQLVKFLKSLQELSIRLLHLPQTIVMDIHKACGPLLHEFIFCADILLAHEEALVDFSHNHFGLVPSCGGVGLLAARIGEARARQWTLVGKAINVKQLKESGLLYGHYSDENQELVVKDLLQNLAAQAPVARIQTKAAFAARLEEAILWSIKNEKNFANVALGPSDWSKAIKGDKSNFTQAKDLAKVLSFHQ